MRFFLDFTLYWAAALSGLFMFYIFGYLSDAILYLLLREIYPCWHSTLVNVVRYVQKKKTKMIRILTVPPFFPSIKLPWNYLNRRKKVNVMVIVPGFFFCYYAHSYWILVKTKIRKNGQILEAVCTLIRDWRNWFSKNCWIHISQCNNFVFFSLLWWNKNIQVGTLT